MKSAAVLVAVAILELCSAARILFLIPVPSKSHFILGERLADALVERGHEITIIAPYKKLKPVRNLREIVLPDFKDELFGDRHGLAHVFLSAQAMAHNPSDGKFEMRNMNPFWLLFTGKFGTLAVDKTMAHPLVRDLLRSDEKFDLVLGECFLMDALLAGFSHKFNAPIVALSTLMPFSHVNDMVGNPAPASYIPETNSGAIGKMSFVQRVKNFLMATAVQIIGYAILMPQQDKLMRQYFGQHLPPLKDTLFNTSLVLVNHHFSLAFPRPYVPNMVEIGGFHVRKPKPLPQDLQKFMDEAKDGVIYFSMGSNLQSSEFPKEKFEGILRAFSKLKQRVLWKFETERSDLPKNVKISKWMPQSDILAHPNVKVFITHGGLLSLTESITRGVPVVGIPIFGDQPANLQQIEAMEMGVKLEYDDIGENSLLSAVRKILNDPKYAGNAKYRSRLLQDVPVSSLDKAVFWVEYVIRHKGARHLRSTAQDLAWYELHQLDVIVFLSVVTSGFLFLLYKSFAWVLKTLGGKRSEGTTSKKLD